MLKKTFMVADGDGNKTIEAEQLATFAYYIQGEQFRFVVTRHLSTIALTQRASGKRVATIPYDSVRCALGDYKLAGESALRGVIDRAGEARVRSVLRAAETA